MPELTDTQVLILFVAAWFILQRFILPRLGVST